MSAGDAEGRLVQANAMVHALQEELAETNKGLMALTMEMEQRVDGRTAELSAAYEELNRTNSELMQLTLELEDRVAQRTVDLEAANQGLAAARIAALNLMEDAVAAREQAERTAADLRREVVERAATQEALRESEERFRTMAESIPQLAWMAKADGFIYWYNRRWFEYTGTTPEQMEGWGWQDVHDSNVLPRVLERWKASIATGLPFDMEFPLRGADGTFRPFLTRVMPFRGTRGEVVQWFGTNTDVSERAAAEQALREANDLLGVRVQERTAELTDALQAIRLLNADLERRAGELEAANKELEAFSYSVSHDLRAPLRAIDGFARIVVEDYADRFDDEGKRKLGVIHASAKKMGQLIDDLLAFSRLGRAAMRNDNVDMRALAASVFHDSTAGDADRADFSLGELPPAPGDAAMLQQVWVNLFANALKFCPPGQKPRIEVSGHAEGAEIVYTVRDHGVGFDMRYADKLFGVFQRLHSAREFPGTGVGLALVQRIVRRHGGRVWGEGTVGEGAAFSFALPARPTEV